MSTHCACGAHRRLALTQFHDAELQLGAPNAQGWEYKAIPYDESDEA